MSLTDEFERALGAIRARVSSFPSTASPIAIAFSGGLDSSVLLHLAHQYALAHGIELFAFHIHHGLSANADQWLASCQKVCAETGVHFTARRVEVRHRARSGIEESARIARYAALGELCRLHGVPLLLTGHHRDDQAETVLLQLLRGSGVAGLSGMDMANTAESLLGADVPVVGRPLLAVSRKQLESCAAQAGLVYVDDESNLDPRFARNALRHHVMPALSDYFPGFQERIARTAQHAQSANRLLQALAKNDFESCSDYDCIDLDRLRHLDLDRIDNLLRYWLGLHHMRMPSTSWLEELRTQLLDAKSDAQLCVTHPDGHVRRYRGRVYLTSRDDFVPDTVSPIAFQWNGEAERHFPSYRGRLFFERADEGVDADWLREQPLVLHFRQGGETLKLAANRPSRSLKHHYQALDVPPWKRERAPLVYANDNLLFAAEIGMNSIHCDAASPMLIRLRWQADQ
jgi:tRNA(Ile)-lysidine synthase